MRSFIVRIRNWYAKFERPISSASLIGGFVFDAIVLERVDLFWENLWVVLHFVVIGIFIILVNLGENENMDDKDASKAHFWYINILQFFFGGLLSTFLVFYFRSSTLSVTWPFLLLLVIAFIANESLKKHYARLTFQISLFYLSLLSFTIFIIPVIFHRIGTDIFLLSGFTSLAILWLFLLSLRAFAKEKFIRSRNMLRLSIAGIFLGTNILYFFNLIPPIPLSLKDGGAYHSLSRDVSGNYVVQSEPKKWLDFFSSEEDIHVIRGESIYAYSAVFSPAALNTDIVHEWQLYEPTTKNWNTVSRITLPVTGGRDDGYRTYSLKENISSGKWRVNVETKTGQIIGRLRFNVIRTNTPPTLETKIKK